MSLIKFTINNKNYFLNTDEWERYNNFFKNKKSFNMELSDYFRADQIQDKLRQLETDRKMLKTKHCNDMFVISKDLVGEKTFNQLKDLVLDYYNRKIDELKEEFERL